MNLQADSDAAYLVLFFARSRYAGYFYLGTLELTNGRLNGAILVAIRSVVASAAEVRAGCHHYSTFT